MRYRFEYSLFFLILSCTSIKFAQSAITIKSANHNVTVEEKYNIYYIRMNENNHAFDKSSPTPLIEITAPDKPAIRTTGQMFIYAMTGSNPYTLLANQSFDYELPNQRSYTFEIETKAETVTCKLEIQNIDDEPPSLTSPQCTFDEKKIYDSANSSCQATVSDPDGWLAYMTFDIVSTVHNESMLFQLEYRTLPNNETYEAPVYMTVLEPLDYQKKTFYLFNIQARDGADHETTPDKNVRATVTVQNIRGNPPVWTTYIDNTQYIEQSVATYQVQARDGDSGISAPVYYKKISEQESSYISIDETSGMITVNKIDRDKNDISTYEFTIMAYVDPAEFKWNSTMTVLLHVVDIDNNPPIIRNCTVNESIIYDFDTNIEKVINLKFLENYASTLNTTTVIRDIDTGENAQFTVQLENYGTKIDYTEAFFVSPNAGYKMEKFELAVKNAKYLDYEDPDWDNFQFYLLVEGTKNTTKRDMLLVNISLIDYNDEIPKFPKSEYEVQINETAKDGTFVAQVMATDRDAEDKILKHTLSGSSFATNVLRIDSDTGKIYINGDNQLDYDKVNPIFVQVIATDKVNHTASASLTIDLLDVNNKAPTISSTEIITVEEGQVAGTKLKSTIKASDPDTTAYLSAEIDWDKSYATKNSRKIVNDTQLPLTRFLDIKYDNLTSNKEIDISLIVSDKNPSGTTPDFELFDSLFITIIVTDWNTDPDFIDKQNATETILIGIINKHDKPPYFPASEIQKTRTIMDRQISTTSAGSIVAIDKDVSNVLSYNCSATNETHDWLRVNQNTGEFTVVSDEITCDFPDYLMNISYMCNAYDGYHYSEPAEIVFTIVDDNNQVPTSSVPVDAEGMVHIPEKSDANTHVVEIQTVDWDRDKPFRTVKCEHKDPKSACAAQFKIRENSVSVTNGGKDINRDAGPDRYVCPLSCYDNPDKEQGGKSLRASDTTFTIRLDDVNDNTPALIGNGSTIKIYETIKANTQIAELIAIDIDEGLHAEIHFDLLDATIDKEDHKDLFDLYCNVSDPYWKINDTYKRARFSSAKDLRGHFGEYHINMNLSDRGDHQNFQTQWILLDVQKWNFDAPRFIFPDEFSKTYRLDMNQKPNSPLNLFGIKETLPNLRVSDEPTGKGCSGRWKFDFSLQSSDINVFVIEPMGLCEAQLQVKKSYTPDNIILDRTFKLALKARISEKKDNEKPQTGEKEYETDYYINVMFVNNTEEPIFTDTTPMKFNFTEKHLEQSHKLTRIAEYESKENRTIFFYISKNENETIKNTFHVDEIDGSISLLKELDYETDEEIIFQIVASNSKNKDFSSVADSYLTVIVEVIGINFYPPEWTQPKFYGVVMKGYQKDFPIVEANATDRDKIDKDNLKYEIFGGFKKHGSGLDGLPNELFLINPNSGKITLNFLVDGSMSGYIDFNIRVSDKRDQFGNGPHSNETTVTIFFITSEYLVRFTFLNIKQEVENKEKEMLRIVTEEIGYNALRQNIEEGNDASQMGNLTTYADLFFINDKGSSVNVVEKTEILKVLSNWNVYLLLVRELRNQTGLQLAGLQESTAVPDNLGEILKISLIAVTVVLGLACIVLLTLFIIKVRQLKNRIGKLVNKKFGSEDSGLNRIGVGLPNSNKHAVEGSNPIFSVSDNIKAHDFFDQDRRSITSGDSELVGIENDPEFDYHFQRNEK